LSRRYSNSATTTQLRTLAGALVLGCVPIPAFSQGPPPQAPPQFIQTCALCHGSDAAGTDRAPALAGVIALRDMPDADVSQIIVKGKGRMPGFPLPSADVDALTRYIHILNSSASDIKITGDPKAGERLFFGDGHCSVCHMALGQGTSFGPDFIQTSPSGLRWPTCKQALLDPDNKHHARATARSRFTFEETARKLHGLRPRPGQAMTSFLQTNDGKLHVLAEGDYRSLVAEKTAAMPPFYGKADQQKRSGRVSQHAEWNRSGGPLTGPSRGCAGPALSPPRLKQVLHPKAGDCRVTTAPWTAIATAISTL
jgi:mono/diheme cytochrome c family protein